jgi:transmembrane sensor
LCCWHVFIEILSDIMVDFNLLIKYFAGKADPEEAMQVEDWAKVSDDHATYFRSLHQSWVEAGDAFYASPDVQQEWENFNSQHINQVKEFQPAGKRWGLRIAAAVATFAVAIAGFYVFNTNNENEPTTIAEATDHAIELKLVDGTKVEVQPESELVYPVKFKKTSREVTLVGSGSFDVVHIPDQPFIVHLGELHVKVLGTAFDIERKREWISVKVKRGKVAFYNKTDTVIVVEGFTGKFMKSDKKLVLEQPEPLVGTFHFNQVPLKDVAAQLSAHFKVRVNITNPAINNCLLSAGFEQQSLKDILTAISATFNFTYTLEGQTAQISGSACK